MAAIVILWSVYALISAVWDLSTFQESLESLRVDSDGPDALDWLTLLIPVVAIPWWLARGHRNAESLSGKEIVGSPAWTAGIWFVPLVGGFLAAAALRRVWSAVGAPRVFVAQTWAILFSLFQFVLLALLVMGVSAIEDLRPAVGGPLSPAEEANLKADAMEAVSGVVGALIVVAGVASACMGLAVLDMDRTLRRLAAGAPSRRSSKPS